MLRRAASVSILAAVTLVLASCSSTSTKAYGGPHAVAIALGCGGFSYREDSRADREALTDRSASCSFDGEDVRIYAFKDSDQRGNFEGVYAEFCGAFGERTASYARGANWIVEPESRTTTGRAAKRLSGDAKTVTCKKP